MSFVVVFLSAYVVLRLNRVLFYVNVFVIVSVSARAYLYAFIRVRQRTISRPFGIIITSINFIFVVLVYLSLCEIRKAIDRSSVRPNRSFVAVCA